MTDKKIESNEFVENVDELGTFTFRRRKMRDQFRIEAEVARLTEGAPVSDDVGSLAMSFACLRILTAGAPAGWDLDEMDPDDPETYAKIIRVYGALRAREDAFRAKPKAASEGAGEDKG